VWGTARNLADIPDVFVERLQHYVPVADDLISHLVDGQIG